MPKLIQDNRAHRPNRSYNVEINYNDQYGPPRFDETWRSLPHWGVDVSDQGRVRDYYTEQFLHVAVARRTSTAIVHVYPPSAAPVDKMVSSLVAEAFLAPPDSRLRLQLHHRDLDRTNNRASNLEYRTHAEITAAHALLRNKHVALPTRRPRAPRLQELEWEDAPPEGVAEREDPAGPPPSPGSPIAYGSYWRRAPTPLLPNPQSEEGTWDTPDEDWVETPPR